MTVNNKFSRVDGWGPNSGNNCHTNSKRLKGSSYLSGGILSLLDNFDKIVNACGFFLLRQYTIIKITVGN